MSTVNDLLVGFISGVCVGIIAVLAKTTIQALITKLSRKLS